MSGLEVSDITNAYTAVRDDKNPTNWLLLTNPPSDSLLPRGSLVLSQTGTGGLAELRDALLHDGCDTEVAYGYVRIEYANDAESAASRHDDNHYIIKERQDDSLVKNLFAFYPSFRL